MILPRIKEEKNVIIYPIEGNSHRGISDFLTIFIHPVKGELRGTYSF
jgi:hypothetical protein